jgi:hypothetical protein
MSATSDPRRLSALYRITALAARDVDSAAGLREMLDVLVATFQADAGSIALLSPESGRLETEVQRGVDDRRPPDELKPGHGVSRLVRAQPARAAGARRHR